MRQKKALNGSHLEVFLALQHSTEHDFDLRIYFLLLFDCCKKLKKNRKEVMLLSFKYV